MPVSPWIVIGSAMILGIVLIVMAWVNLNREKAYITRILTEKGAALIKSFEAGARTGMRGDLGSQIKLQTLLRETAAQSDIVYLTVTDDSGTILAHSNEERIGHTFLDLDRLQDLNPGMNIQSRILSAPHLPRAFLVYSTFTPLRAEAHRMGMGPGHRPDWQSRHGGMLQEQIPAGKLRAGSRENPDPGS